MQLILFLLLFVVAILGFVYLFQTSYLDDFYNRNKIKTLYSVGNDIVSYIGSDELDDVIDQAGMSNEVCVRVVSNNEKYSYTITMPAKTRCLTKPVHKEITVGNAKLLIDVQVDGQTVTINRQLSLPAEGISAKSVKKFKAMMGEWEAPVKVVFSL